MVADIIFPPGTRTDENRERGIEIEHGENRGRASAFSMHEQIKTKVYWYNVKKRTHFFLLLNEKDKTYNSGMNNSNTTHEGCRARRGEEIDD